MFCIARSVFDPGGCNPPVFDLGQWPKHKLGVSQILKKATEQLLLIIASPLSVRRSILTPHISRPIYIVISRWFSFLNEVSIEE